ncbi:glycerophosphoryl diester phosphodiesterase [Deinococcus metalli]|uniref:Glycerophosphoryl diester phosphodiesterase n=1 Tax=Deinococcus metalli TaxID=1141878 RepID=A0A7W8NRA8_9DEIO|nr:glycerophosphodiester phosphodiesterase [Deinococcus metalli]MBB5377720.1 glycerophosphoryl diester phosphodiesterase [Deinococcus metalli]GHF52825.1 glycerophosphoryl diester phosphodiesterase [Deinococcus metalli]
MTPLLLGHRGTPRLHRENTLAGFQAALDAGLDGVELDVRRLADGTLVIHHDEALPDGRLLPFLTLDELPAEVPTLDAALAWAADTGAYVNVELKYESARPDDRVPRSLDAIRAHGLARHVILSSFNPLVLVAARQAAPDIERGFLYHKTYARGPLDAVPLAMRAADCVALHPHHSLIDAALMTRAQRRGWRVNTWTVNEPADVARLTQLGVSALIGDLPDVLLTAR